MDCRVISISRTVGSGAEEIGRKLAADLGFRYVDGEIIDWAAEKAGVSRETIEKVERTPPLIDRILQHLGNAPMEHGAYLPPAVASTPIYESVFEQVIKETASRGNVIIVAHGASVPLAGTAGLLRVLVTASPPVRAQRIAERADIGIRKARKAIDDSDRERGEYLQRLYGVRHEQTTDYDMVLNTDVLTTSAAAAVILVAARG
jgi:cytidylate kinase